MQRLLLDTHTLLWAIQDDPSLNANARSAIVDPLNDVFVSAASVWEIAIKRSLGRLEAPDNLGEEVISAGFIELPVTILHGELAARLPLYHGDPFDRMLVAQAQAEGLVLVTRDSVLRRYGVRTLTA